MYIYKVAPHAGAWIETARLWAINPKEVWSRPMRARGLKRQAGRDYVESGKVAPHAGAWIETVSLLSS